MMKFVSLGSVFSVSSMIFSILSIFSGVISAENVVFVLFLSVARLAPTVNSVFCISSIICRVFWWVVFARRSPRNEFSSSMVPYAFSRGLFLGTRFPPMSVVVPLSPVLVYIFMFSESDCIVLFWYFGFEYYYSYLEEVECDGCLGVCGDLLPCFFHLWGPVWVVDDEYCVGCDFGFGLCIILYRGLVSVVCVDVEEVYLWYLVEEVGEVVFDCSLDECDVCGVMAGEVLLCDLCYGGLSFDGVDVCFGAGGCEV